MGPVPRILHQTWKTADVPREWAGFAASWRAHHPGWEYRLWTDEANRAFVAEHYPDLLDAYDAYPYGIMRADAVRYCLLHHFGGVYVDLDFECLRAIDELIATERFVVALEPAAQSAWLGTTSLVSNAFMAAPPSHPLLQAVLDELRHGARDAVTHFDVLGVTGPLMLQRVLERHKGDGVTVLPAGAVFPYVANAPDLKVLARGGKEAAALKESLIVGGAFAVHHWANSWVGTLAGELRNPDPDAIAGYDFHPGLDSPGHDIANVGRDIPLAAKRCDAISGAVAFNTDGFVKHTLLPRELWVPIRDAAPNAGLYVRRRSPDSREEPHSQSTWGSARASPVTGSPAAKHEGHDILSHVNAGVRIRGPFTGPSGYDHHVREFVRCLSGRGIPVQLENVNEWSPVRLPHNLRDPWFESLTGDVDAPVTLHFCFPTQVQHDPARANVNFTMFEGTRIPDAWVRAHTLCDLIVVPTEHSYRAWVRSGVPESKLRLCPLGVRTDLYRPGVPPLQLTGDTGLRAAATRVRFLNVSEVGPRKNYRGLVSAWLRATTPEDDAALILKAGCYSPGTVAMFEQELRAAKERAAKRREQAAPIHVIQDVLPDADMPRLFAAATHYISLSLGEGWDLAMTEAAASGLRLIASAHSGYLAYLDEDIASMVPAREVPANMGSNTWFNDLFHGVQWWEPDEDAAVAMIRRAIEGNDAPKLAARDRIAERFTWDAATDRLTEVLAEAAAIRSR